MSAFIQTATSIHDLARTFGLSGGMLDPENPASEQFRLDLKRPDDASRKLDTMIQRADAKFGGARMDERRRHDAATAFTTNALQQILAPEVLVSAERFLFTPGRTQGAPLLPVQQLVALGKQELAYDVIAHTGEARRMAHGATKDLRRVGSTDDRKKQPVILYGVRFGWSEFDLWQAVHIGRSPQVENQMAASQAMAEYFEDCASYGVLDVKVPGFFNHGSVFTIAMATNMVSATADQMISQLSYMHAAWKRANPRHMITGVAMPCAHYLAMIQLFKGTSGEGMNAWEWAVKAFPWLANIVEDDRLLTSSQDGFSMWQFWSADSSSQYVEASPTPMLYGPFNDELDTTFIMIGQHGGVVNKNPRRIMRVNMPS